MYIKKITDGKEIQVALPLTANSGKVRIKQRSKLNEYGFPVATRQVELNKNCYVEWQIGYDVPVADERKFENTTLKDLRFTGANENEKALYELSEYVYYLVKWNLISKLELENAKNYIKKIPSGNLIDTYQDFSIKRSDFIENEINGLTFSQAKVEYPLIVYKFGKSELIAEIIIREKQRAIGVMPMLYLCFPVTKLKTKTVLLGRTTEQNEEAQFIINKENADVFLQLLKIFGMLSETHRTDVLSIIKTILKAVP